ncbi:MAG: hypothetical protein R2684_05885 [Pyrinomonadaceae bacterium]
MTWLPFSNRILFGALLLLIPLLLVGAFTVSVWLDVDSSLNSLRREDNTSGDIVHKLVPLERTVLRSAMVFGGVPTALDIAEYNQNLYVATDSGVYVFSQSGVEIGRYSTLDGLPNAKVTAIAAFSGKLYMGTAAGELFSYDGRSFTLIQFAKISTGSINAILSAKDSMLIGTETAGLLQYDGTSFVELKVNRQSIKSIISLTRSAGGPLFVGTRESGVAVFDGKSWNVFDTGNGLHSNRILGATQTATGASIIATDLGLYTIESGTIKQTHVVPALSGVLARERRLVYSRENCEVSTYPEKEILVSGKQLVSGCRLRTSGNDSYLLGPGLVRRIGERESWSARFNLNPSAAKDKSFSALLSTKDGKLLAGDFRNGVSEISEIAGQLVATDFESRVSEINGISETEGGSYLISTSRGLFERTRNGELAEIGAATGASYFQSREAIHASAKGIEINSGRNRKALTVANGLPPGAAYTILRVGDYIFAGTMGGLALVKNGKVEKVWNSTNSNLQANWVSALAEFEGRFFVATYGGGVFEVSTEHSLKRVGNLGRKLFVNLNALLVIEGKLVAGTTDGIWMADLKTGLWSKTKLPLPSQMVLSLCIWRERLVVGTDAGLFAISIREFSSLENSTPNF